MPLTLYMHPLASFCWKPLIALYECDVPFVPRIVDLSDAVSRAELEALWPMAKFPVLKEDSPCRVVAESSIIIEYLAQRSPSASRLIPKELDAALEVRTMDRFFDLHVHEPMQKIVGDRIRPSGTSDPYGVEQAKKALRGAYAVVEERMKTRAWAAGSSFTMADCAAAPALYYANRVVPFEDSHPNTAAFLARLHERPAFARVIDEATPYFSMFPG